ncbi:MAG TPA: hypothetical protein PLA21_07335 [Rectinema sp.]|nr:hypothetical protein [Rectinema sp.]
MRAIEKRVAALETRNYLPLEQLEMLSLDVLTDSELGILEEYLGLYHAGFAPDEIQRMMSPDVYNEARSILEMIEIEYGRLLAGRNYNHIPIQRQSLSVEERSDIE